MLRKWFDAFKALDPAHTGVLSLTTNRRPDADIEACLDDGKISFPKIPEPRRSEVIAELGGSKTARRSSANCKFVTAIRVSTR